ncbi:MAG: hypothetical protein Ct9H300mP16_13620 [Pseudomonadota bacterium]|nr:MAG: hypothetical protein Ct9H300mP16_13620 [Pseudomonadota bacterium]
MQVCLSPKHHAVGAPERSARGTHIDAGRVFAMLAQKRHGQCVPRRLVNQVGFTDPLGIGAWAPGCLQPVFLVAGRNTGIAAVDTSRNVDQQAPANLCTGWIIFIPGQCKLRQSDTRCQRQNRTAGCSSGE